MSRAEKVSTFRAFRNRNYTLFFCGQSVSRIGTFMQNAAVAWVIYTLTHSTFMLGLSIFTSQFPSFLFSLYGGILADRYNRHKMLLITQSASMAQAILLAILTLTNHYAVWEILTLNVILGVVNAFDVPARQPLVHELVHDKADLPNALALNSSMNNLARLIGPAMAGILLVKFGAGICFLLNAISFVAVLVSLLLLELPPYIPPTVKKKIAHELSEGFTYLKKTPEISIILLLASATSLLVTPYDTLIPVFAKVIFKGDAATFGWISSFIGGGAIAGSIFMASLKKGADLKMVLFVNSIIQGIGLMLFSHMVHFWPAMALAVVFGFGGMAVNTICLTIIQVKSAPQMRGRVMSYIAMSIFGMLPLGSLLTGAISQQIGAPNTVLCQGIISIVIALLFSKFLRKDRLNRKEMEAMKIAETEVAQEI